MYTCIHPSYFSSWQWSLYSLKGIFWGKRDVTLFISCFIDVFLRSKLWWIIWDMIDISKICIFQHYFWCLFAAVTSECCWDGQLFIANGITRAVAGGLLLGERVSHTDYARVHEFTALTNTNLLGSTSVRHNGQFWCEISPFVTVTTHQNENQFKIKKCIFSTQPYSVFILCVFSVINLKDD